MEITERDLEDLIFSSLDTDPTSLKQIGFKTRLITNYPHENSVRWLRQVDLKDYGRADIIGYGRFYGQIVVEIIELKNVPITAKDVEQVMRYRHGVTEIIRNTLKGHYYPEINAYLVGPSLETGHFLENAIPTLKIMTFSYGLKGFQFKTTNGKWFRGGGELRLKDATCANTTLWVGDPKALEGVNHGE